MFERFTDRARKVMALANQEAQRFNHEYIGTEHILLGLLFFSYALPHIFILSEDRFHLALVPYIAILAAQFWVNGFSALTSRWNESLMGKIIVFFAVLALFLLLINWSCELSRDAGKISQLLGPNGNQSHFPY